MKRVSRDPGGKIQRSFPDETVVVPADRLPPYVPNGLPSARRRGFDDRDSKLTVKTGARFFR